MTTSRDSNLDEVPERSTTQLGLNRTRRADAQNHSISHSRPHSPSEAGRKKAAFGIRHSESDGYFNRKSSAIGLMPCRSPVVISEH